MAKEIQLTTAEAFYVESHFGLKTPAVMAKELGVPAKRVQKYVDKLAEADVQPKKPKGITEKAGFAEKDGSVAMTNVASEHLDDIKKKSRTKEFVERRSGKSIHVIDPNKPVR